MAWGSPVEGTGELEHTAGVMAGCFPLSLLRPGSALYCHRVVAGVSPTRGAGRGHPRAQLLFQQHPSHRGQAAVPAPLAASFFLWFVNNGRGEPHPAAPPGDLCTGGSSASLSQQLRAASFSFLSLSCLRGWEGIGKDLGGSHSAMPAGGGLAPSLTRAGGEVPRAWAAG